MEHAYDPLLRARKESLADLIEDLTDKEYIIAEKAIDLFFDKIEYLLEHTKKMTRNAETGRLTVIVDEYDSNSKEVVQ